MRKLKRFRAQSLALRLLVTLTGALQLMIVFTPKANAACPGGPDCVTIQHFNFNSEINSQPPPYTSVEGGTTLFNNAPPEEFPPGNIFVNSSAGTTVNAFDSDPAGGALTARGNPGTTNYCFTIGPLNTQIGFLENVSLSFAIRSVGNGGQFNTLILAFSTNGTTFTNFQTINNLQSSTSFTAQNFTLPLAANNQPTLFIQFCFTNTRNNADGNNTFIDNIQVNGLIPEPSTLAGGLLGLVGLCWFQRQRFRFVLPRLRKP